MAYKIYLISCLSFVAYLLGGWDMGIEIMLTFVIIDYLTGIAKAIYTRTLNSYIGWKGIVKKIGLFICIIIAVKWECLVSQPETLHNIVAFAISVNESISILENLIAMNVTVPPFLTKYLKKMKEKEDKKDGEK